MNNITEELSKDLYTDLVYIFWHSPYYRSTVTSPNFEDVSRALKDFLNNDGEYKDELSSGGIDSTNTSEWSENNQWKRDKVDWFFQYANFCANMANRYSFERYNNMASDKDQGIYQNPNMKEDRYGHDRAMVEQASFDSAMESSRKVLEVAKRLKDPIDWDKLKNS